MKRNQNASPTPEKPLYKRKRVWLGAILAVGILGNLLPEVETEDSTDEQSPAVEVAAETTPKTKETAAVATKPKATEDKKAEPVVNNPTIESIVREVAGDNYVSHESEDGVLYVNMILADNFTANAAVKSAYDKVLEISEGIVANDLLGDDNAVHYFFTTEIIDVYGNSSQQNVLGVKFSADTLAQINFDNVKIDNIPVIADAHFRHSALNK